MSWTCEDTKKLYEEPARFKLMTRGERAYMMKHVAHCEGWCAEELDRREAELLKLSTVRLLACALRNLPTIAGDYADEEFMSTVDSGTQ